jgi:maleylacetoacetate isomerase
LQWITTNFKSLESLLAHHSGKYCVGDEITLADVCLVPQVRALLCCHAPHGRFSKMFAQVFNATRFGVDMSQFPTIQRINAVLEEREEFKAAHPDAQPDKPPPSA